MSKPIVTLALSNDGNSVFVYSGGLEQADDGREEWCNNDTRDLEAVIGLQRADFDPQLQDWVRKIIEDAVQA